MESPQPVDEIMQTLQPRMAAAKRRYARRWFSALLVLPLLIGIGVASANLNDEPVTSLAQVADGGNAVGGPSDTDPDKQDDAPKVDPVEVDEANTESDDTESDDSEPEETEVETEVDEYEWMSVDLGMAGTAEVRQEGDLLVLGKVELRDGWTASPFVDEGNELVLVLNNGTVHLVASLWVAEDVVKVELDDHSEPTAEEKAAAEKAEQEKAAKAEAEKAAAEKAAAEKAEAEKAEAEKKAAAEKAEKEKAEKEQAEKDKTEKEPAEKEKPEPTPKPDPEPTPTPEPESTLRSEIALYDYATVVVEADGASLELAVTWLKDGWEPHVVQGTGELVHVYVTDGQYNKHLKAWVADGKIKHELWWEEVEQPQTAGIVEVDVYGKGAVKVALDGDKLYLDVLWAKEGWTAVVVHDADDEVHMYFTDGSVEKHMAAWIDGEGIAHELWVDEAPSE